MRCNNVALLFIVFQSNLLLAGGEEPNGNTTTVTFDKTSEFSKVDDLFIRQSFNSVMIDKYRSCAGDHDCLLKPLFNNACVLWTTGYLTELSAKGIIEASVDFTATDTIPVVELPPVMPNQKSFTIVLTYDEKIDSEWVQKRVSREIWRSDLDWRFSQPSAIFPGQIDLIWTATGPINKKFTVNIQDQASNIKMGICNMSARSVNILNMKIRTIQD